MNNINGYNLSRNWFDFCFENPEITKPNHTALYFFAIEHCNRLGWKQKFGFPTTMVMEAIGIKSYNTYINTLNDLVGFGFIEMIEKSKNQYSANIIALSNKVKALDKALDKAFIKHGTKQCESTVQSIDSIIKQINNKQLTIEQLNNKQIDFLKDFLNKDKKEIVFPFDSDKFKNIWIQWKLYKKDEFGFKYKSTQSEQAALIKLSKMAKTDEQAEKIILQSIENGWKGFFDLQKQTGKSDLSSFKQEILNRTNGQAN